MADPKPVTIPVPYMPQTYRRRRGEVWKFAYLGGMAAVGFAIFDWFHPGESFAIFMSQATVLLLLAAGAVVALIQRWTVDCRIEGTTLTIENPPMLAPISVQVDDILEIVTLLNPQGMNEHEMAVQNRGRMNVGPELFTPLGPLKAALLAINPNIKFTQRGAGTCFACGNSIVINGMTILKGFKTGSTHCCENCGEPWARRGRFT